MEALGVIGFGLLLLHVVTQVALAFALRPAGAGRVVLAVFFPPLGIVWGWEAGAKRRVLAYGASLAAFGAMVVAIMLVR